MQVSVETIGEFKAQMPVAYKLLVADYIKNVEEKHEDFSDLVDYIRESYLDSKETVDSDYITEVYKFNLEGFKFEVVGTQYRKDQSICDEEMIQEITITDIAKDKEEKKTKKESKADANELLWHNFIIESSTEQVFQMIKHFDFPKKK